MGIDIGNHSSKFLVMGTNITIYLISVFCAIFSASTDSSAKQVVHFYCWKASALQTVEVTIDTKVVKLSAMQSQKINGLTSVVLNDHGLAVKVFCSSNPSKEGACIRFDWTGIVAAVNAWGNYTANLIRQIHLQLPYWRSHQFIYNVQVGE